jgi:molybdenum-dependent DNA-binding transcriptional regulator ModE
MTEPEPVRRALRKSNGEYRWNRDKIIALVRAFTATGSVTASARTVGMSRQSAYRLRARMGASFAELWDDALRVGHRRRHGLRMTAAQGDRPVPR